MTPARDAAIKAMVSALLQLDNELPDHAIETLSRAVVELGGEVPDISVHRDVAATCGYHNGHGLHCERPPEHKGSHHAVHLIKWG